jgi:hypothetical protein
MPASIGEFRRWWAATLEFLPPEDAATYDPSGDWRQFRLAELLRDVHDGAVGFTAGDVVVGTRDIASLAEVLGRRWVRVHGGRVELTPVGFGVLTEHTCDRQLLLGGR